MLETTAASTPAHIFVMTLAHMLVGRDGQLLAADIGRREVSQDVACSSLRRSLRRAAALQPGWVAAPHHVGRWLGYFTVSRRTRKVADAPVLWLIAYLTPPVEQMMALRAKGTLGSCSIRLVAILPTSCRSRSPSA